MTMLDALALMHTRALRPYSDDPALSDWADVLKTFPLFAGVRKRRLRKLVRTARTLEFAPGESIVVSGDRDDVLYVILGGKVEAVSRTVRRTLRTGDYFGELAMIDGDARSANVVAISDVHVMSIPRRSVLKLARRHPVVALEMLRELSGRLRALEVRTGTPRRAVRQA